MPGSERNKPGTGFAFLAIVICLLVVQTSAQAQSLPASPLLIESLRPQVQPEPEKLSEVFTDWVVTCPNPALADTNTTVSPRCTMQPQASAYEGAANIKRLYAQMIAVNNNEAQVPVFVLETQLDLLLPEGILFQIDAGKPQKLAYRSCHADGCIVPFRLTSQMRAALRRGTNLKLTFKTLEGATGQVTISLLGFTRALQALANSVS